MSKEIVRIGYGTDWTGSATLKYQIVAETTDGRYILKRMPIEMTRIDGSKYLAEPFTGLILRDRKEIKVVELLDKG